MSQQGYNSALLYVAGSNTDTDILQWLIDHGVDDNSIRNAINILQIFTEQSLNDSCYWVMPYNMIVLFESVLMNE